MKKLFLISILSILIFMGCKKDGCEFISYPEHSIDQYPSQEDLSWITLEQDDTLLFISNQGNYDTIVVNLSPLMSFASFDEGTYNSCKTYDMVYQKAMSFGLRKNGGFSSGLVMLISPNTPANVPPILNTPDWTTSQNFSLTSINTSDLQVGGQMFNNVYEVVRDSLSLSSHSQAWRFYYQKENGLLRFDDIGGIRWERIN